MTTFSTILVGMHFRPAEARELVSAFEVGTTLKIEREPENPYDQNAIKVMFDLDGRPVHVGYIAKEDAIYIAPHLDEGSVFETVVTGFETRGRNSHPLLSVSDD